MLKHLRHLATKETGVFYVKQSCTFLKMVDSD